MRTLVSVIAAVVLSGVPSAAQSAIADDPRRDSWQRPADIFAAMGAVPGARVADIGAGEGWLTTRLAKAVGPTGRVFAVDISETTLASLKRTLEEKSLANVELVLGKEDDARLPSASLDGIVVVNAYHEMVHVDSILASFRRALKIGGRLVIVDNAPPDSTASRQIQTRYHYLAMALAEADLVGHGFEIVRRENDFARNGTTPQWLIAAVRRK